MTPRSAAPLLAESEAPSPSVSQPDRRISSVAPPEGDSGALALFERLVCDPNASVDKIERMMALWERSQAKIAESEFNRAMTAAQHEMRPVAADAWNPQTKSHYASYEALDAALRPIYTTHGFALTFNTADAPRADYLRVVCTARHAGGHAEVFLLDLPADGKGAKGGDVMTKTHATGSGLSYGQRYLLKMIFNVAVGEHDDDGNGASGTPTTTDPDGYQLWLDDLSIVAEDGLGKLTAAWNGSKIEFRNHLLATNKPAWETIKRKAKAVCQ